MFKKEIHEMAFDLYQNSNLTTREIARKIGMSQGGMSILLKRNNIPPRKPGIHYRAIGKYSKNENYFENIDSQEKAYLLGFFYADGNVHISPDKKTQVVSIGLQLRDKPLLEVIKNQLEFSGPLRDKKNNSSYLQIYSKKLCADLIKLGCVERKSLTLKWPTEQQVPNVFIWHFIRGAVDGDGCIFKTKTTNPNHRSSFGIHLMGSEPFINGLLEFLKEFNISPSISMHRNNKNKIIVISKIEDMRKFGNLMYNDAKIFLSRKKEKFNEFIEHRKFVEKNPSRVFRKTINDEPYRRCPSCLIYKSLARDYHKNPYEFDKHAVYCKPCTSEKAKQRNLKKKLERENVDARKSKT